ncbi:HAD superfamily hydrolase [Syntrophotalea carbinolica DSM 2380]|uniref:HAD superfamily hydrolase n=1 Tax=Syntrophotalea carbinolica (strain DSM 2380 / NBRC 103641 / GraBd1) TaxID=338963 RepID=Q3A7F9_SYNC1|nr:HAD family hydrolase [Syntrophotalea carbinolica]ABA87685.1 HAD superfamily hydrolase [Syntrophotalea carbinolica DSM 2380]
MKYRCFCGLLIAGLLLFLPLSGQARQVVCDDSLSLWQDRPAKKAVLDFVQRVTDPNDAAYVPPQDRIVTIDMDGTLVCERPTSVGMLFAENLLREWASAPQLQGREPFEAARRDGLRQMRKKHFELFFGLSGAGFEEGVLQSKMQTMVRGERHPRYKRPYRELFYDPMLQLVHYLIQNDFVVYVVSGSDQTLVRVLCAERPELAGLPPARFIGTLVALDVDFADGKPVYYRLARELEPVNLRKGKALNILYRIGQYPILAIGNSKGDCGMLAVTHAAKYPETLRLLLNHDDAGREFAYPGPTGSDAALCREQAGADILSISMRDDFEKIFAFDSGL